ncbi:MAG: flagellar export chaperone FliS [Labilithrix sp.]|nr:flagellar export chaperone FliS [Labilithrix sp.]MBX3210441.1 flagellar export chaperone FliS [Labilithrix sp.]
MNALMSAAAAASRYRGVQLNTASPAQLVVMLYDGMLRFVGEADDALTRGDRARAGERIGRAIAIVDELAATLDPAHAPELAENLIALYGFCKRRLFDANLNRDRDALADVVASLTPLREAWASVAAGR